MNYTEITFKAFTSGLKFFNPALSNPAQLLLKANSWQRFRCNHYFLIIGNSKCITEIYHKMKPLLSWSLLDLCWYWRPKTTFFVVNVTGTIKCVWTLVHNTLNITRFKWIIKAFSGMRVLTLITSSVIWSSLLISVTWRALLWAGL